MLGTVSAQFVLLVCWCVCYVVVKFRNVLDTSAAYRAILFYFPFQKPLPPQNKSLRSVPAIVVRGEKIS